MNFIHKILIICYLTLQATTFIAQGVVTTNTASSCINCDGSAIFEVDFVGNVGYIWYDENYTSISTSNNATGSAEIQDLCVGVYFVEAISSNNTIYQTIFNIESQITNNTMAQDIYICSNSESIDLNQYIEAGIDVSGTWTNDQNINFDGTLTGNITTPIASGLYLYTLDEGACQVSSGINLTVNVSATPGLSTTYLICENYPPFLLTDHLGGDPDYGGDWYDSSNTLTTGFFDTNNQDTEIFTYVIDTVQGCNAVLSTLFVIENFLSNAGIDTEITVCENAPTFDLFDQLEGNPELTGNWLNPNFDDISSTFNSSTSEAGVYTYSVSGNTPCPSAQAELTINYSTGLFSGDGIDTSFCDTSPPLDFFSLITGLYTPGGVWTDSNNNLIDSIYNPTIDQPGNYTYTIAGAGCITQSTTLSIAIENQTYAGSDTLYHICETINSVDLNDLLSLNANTIGIWTLANEEILPEISIDTVGSTLYYYEIEHSLCANNSAEIQIIVDPSVNAGEDSSIVVCFYDDQVILNNLLANSSSNTGEWFHNNTLVSNVFNPQTSEIGTYTYVLDPQNSCSIDEAAIFTTIIDTIDFELLSLHTVCENESNIQIGLPNNPNYQYSWTPTEFLTNTSNSNPTVEISQFEAPNEIEFTVIIQNEACIKTSSTSLTIAQNPTITLQNDTNLCEGQSITLTIPFFDSIHWSPDYLFSNISANVQTISPSNNIQVTVEVLNENGCSAEDEMNITSLPLPQLSYAINAYNHCTPAEIQLNNTSNNSGQIDYQWSFTNGAQSAEESLVIAFESPVNFEFTLQGVAENGCTSIISSQQPVNVFKSPVASFMVNANDLSIYNNTIVLENLSNFASTYKWTVDWLLFSIEHSPDYELPTTSNKNYLFCLEAIEQDFCKDTTCRNIYMPYQQEVFVPNAFTPNNDNINDVFSPYISKKELIEYHLSIYNRWGQQIFHTDKLYEGWSGNTINNPGYYADNGVYTWILIIKESSIGNEQKFQGKVSVIR